MTIENQENQNNTFIVEFESAEPYWFTFSPSIISKLTYLNKNGQRVKISANAREVYRAIKAAAGERGICWQSTETLAEETNLSMGTVSNCKKELLQPMIELGGKPLITIEEFKRDASKGRRPSHVIRVVNIWGESRNFKEKLATSKYEVGKSPQLPPQENTTSKYEVATSPGECNNNSSYYNSSIETTNYPQIPSPSLVSSSFGQANANILASFQHVGAQASQQAPRQVPAPKPNPKPPEKKTPEPQNRVVANNQPQPSQNSLVSSSSSKIKALEELLLTEAQKKTIYSMKTDSKGNSITEERILKGISCLYEGIEDVGGFLYKAIYNNYERKMTEEDRKKIDEANKKLEEEKRDQFRLKAIKVVQEIQQQEPTVKISYFKDRIELKDRGFILAYYHSKTFYEEFVSILKSIGNSKYISLFS